MEKYWFIFGNNTDSVTLSGFELLPPGDYTVLHPPAKERGTTYKVLVAMYLALQCMAVGNRSNAHCKAMA